MIISLSNCQLPHKKSTRHFKSWKADATPFLLPQSSSTSNNNESISNYESGTASSQNSDSTSSSSNCSDEIIQNHHQSEKEGNSDYFEPLHTISSSDSVASMINNQKISKELVINDKLLNSTIIKNKNNSNNKSVCSTTTTISANSIPSIQDIGKTDIIINNNSNESSSNIYPPEIIIPIVETPKTTTTVNNNNPPTVIDIAPTPHPQPSQSILPPPSSSSTSLPPPLNKKEVELIYPTPNITPSLIATPNNIQSQQQPQLIQQPIPVPLINTFDNNNNISSFSNLNTPTCYPVSNTNYSTNHQSQPQESSIPPPLPPQQPSQSHLQPNFTPTIRPLIPNNNNNNNSYINNNYLSPLPTLLYSPPSSSITFHNLSLNSPNLNPNLNQIQSNLNNVNANSGNNNNISKMYDDRYSSVYYIHPLYYQCNTNNGETNELNFLEEMIKVQNEFNNYLISCGKYSLNPLLVDLFSKTQSLDKYQRENFELNEYLKVLKEENMILHERLRDYHSRIFNN